MHHDPANSSSGCIFFMFSLLFLILSCGGGGGSGGSQEGESNHQVGNSSSGVRLIHSALDSPPFDLFSNLLPGELLQQGSFSEVSGYSSVPSGSHVFSFVVPSIGGERLTSSLSYAEGERHTLFLTSAFGDGDIKVNSLSDDLPELVDGEAGLRF